ncbi:MAG: transcriptional repressor LexA [Treponema sp.]|nr:transcriptional repressor LexA [Treponema sp.]
MKDLTDRQKQVISFIADYIKENSYPPAIRDIAAHFSISVKGAHDHIIALRKKGHLKHTNKLPRTMGLVYSEETEDSEELVSVPLLGSVAAGIPLLAEENFDGNIKLHRSMIKKSKNYFALKVKGDSMSGAGILEGDVAIIEKLNTVRNGEIAVAIVDEAATLKRFYKENTRIKLQSENPDYPPIYSSDVRILGRLSNIIRSY